MISLDKNITIIRNTKTKKPEDFIAVPFSSIIDRVTNGLKGLDQLTITGRDKKNAAVEAEGTDAAEAKADEYRNWKANNLPAILPAGVWDKLVDEKATHGYAGWSGTHTGFITLDFDNLEDLDTLVTRLKGLAYVFFLFVSPSGKGVKVFVCVDPLPKDDTEHKIAWDALKSNIEAAAGMEVAVDKQCKNINRLCYLAHDPNAYLNSDATEFKWSKPKPETQPTFNDTVDIFQAREILKYVSADDYDDWINTGIAIKLAGLPFSVWYEWSRTSPNFNESDDLQKRWDGFNPDGRISWGSVVHKAKANGYVFPSNQNESPELAERLLKKKTEPEPEATVRFPVEVLAGSLAETYIEAYQGKSEVCPGFHFGSFLHAFASVAGDKILYTLDGSEFVKTNFYQCLLGRPAWARKSTALKNAEDLIRSVTQDFLIFDTLNTREGFIAALDEDYPKVTIILDEMNALFTKAKTTAGAGLVDMLNSAYDSKPLSNRSMSNPKTVLRTTASLLGAITPKLLDKALNEESIGGGFVSRCVFYDWERQGRVRAWGGVDEERLKTVKNVLLRAAGIQESIIYTWSAEALAVSTQWYENFAMEDTDEDLDAVGRIPYLADKLSAMLSFIENPINDNSIHLTTWEMALPIAEYWGEIYRKYIVKSSYMTEDLKYQERILKFLQRYPEGATKSDLCKLRSIATKKRNEILDALVVGENVYYDSENRKYHAL